MASTGARLRKTFHYPADDDDPNSSEPEVMDEEEQAQLISRLSAQNSSQNYLYTRALLSLPALSSIPYLLSLFHLIPSPYPLVSLLALSSLASTAWVLWALAPTKTGIIVLDGLQDRDADAPQGQKQHTTLLKESPSGGPLGQYLPLLNLGLCSILTLTGLLGPGDHNEAGPGQLWLAILPGIVYGVVVAAKMVMASVDPEKELGVLKYEYKGA